MGGGRTLRLGWARGRALRLGQTWEVAAWEIAHLGNIPWEVATWEKSFGKVPNNLNFQCFKDIIFKNASYFKNFFFSFENQIDQLSSIWHPFKNLMVII